jgi:tetratricopeptide (TPR) repeat protein
VLAVVCLFAGGCAASRAFHRGESAEYRQEYDRAVVEYTKALRLDPNSSGTRLALDRAKIRASENHFNRGRRLAATGKLDQALIEFELAAELNPSSGDIDDELRATQRLLSPARAKPSCRRSSNGRAICRRPAWICRSASRCRRR